ncbi:unnamed protein product, partial [Closterium sp. Yama58-4]
MAEEEETRRLKALPGAVGLGSFNAMRAAQGKDALSAAGGRQQGADNLFHPFTYEGAAAEEADNLFHPLTYEGAADLDSLSSLVVRRGFETQINEFGQTPRQLFVHPHPQRSPRPTPS